MIYPSSTLFKLLVLLFCVVMVLVIEVQCRTLQGNARPDTLTRDLGRFYGVKDDVSNRSRRDAQDNRWPPGSNLTYRVGRGPTHGVLKDVNLGGLVQLAFEEWAPHCGLHFTQIHSGEANITISFESRLYWNFPIGLLGGIAYTSDFPSKDRQSLQVHFDDDEEWTLVPTPGRLHFYSNLLHELGHALGLTHSRDGSSIMYAVHDSTFVYLHLQNEDESRMRKLYDVSPDEASTTELLAEPSSNKNTTDVSPVEASTTELSAEPSSSKNTTVLSLVEASVAVSSD